MSDRFNSNPGNGGNNGDMYRWSGDQGQLPGNNGQNQSGDRYIYDGSRQNFQNGDQQDPFQGDRMPGRARPNDSDYPQTFTTREVRADGTIIINNVHCKNAYFNQSQIDGADYRRDPKMDFRGYDPNVSRLRENQGGTSFYDGDNRSAYNGSFRIPENRNNRQNDDMEWRIAAERQREFRTQELRERQVEIARQRAYDQTYGQEQYIGQTHQWQQQRDCDQAIRIQMYNEHCRQANGRDRERYQPYYGGNDDGCFGNGRSNGGWNRNNGGWNNGGYDDGYDSRYGGPCFGNQRSGISIRIPLGHNGSFRIGL